MPLDWTSTLFEHAEARLPVRVERPRHEVVEQLHEARLAVGRVERVAALIDDHIADRTSGLLPDRLDREQISGNRRAVARALRHEERHGTVAHVLDRRAVEPERLPPPRRMSFIHDVVVRTLKRTNLLEDRPEPLTVAGAACDVPAEKWNGAGACEEARRCNVRVLQFTKDARRDVRAFRVAGQDDLAHPRLTTQLEHRRSDGVDP